MRNSIFLITWLTIVTAPGMLSAAESAPVKQDQIPAATNASVAPVNAVQPPGRIELFNGIDFAGWKFCMRTNADPMLTWSITNGLIKCAGRPTGYMRTEQAYKDYKVTVEWRFTKPGNTGVTVHMQEPDKIWPPTIECQGQHDHQGDFWMQGGATCEDHTTPDKRRVPMTEASNEKPVGEWNTYEVVCSGDTVQIYVNGKLMNEVGECSLTSGYIGIQSEGAELEIRKIQIEPL